MVAYTTDYRTIEIFEACEGFFVRVQQKSLASLKNLSWL
jgi:hypothetical protein